MKAPIQLLTVCLFFILGSCNKTSNNGSVDWTWVKTYGSIAGATWTPTSTGMTKTISLSGNQISFYEDGILVDEFDYEIFDTDTIFNDNVIRTFIKYNGNTQLYEETSAILVMRDLCADCYDYHYEK